MNGFHSGSASKSINTRHTRSTGASMSVSVHNSRVALTKEASGLQLLRDLLDRLLDILGLAGPRAHELPAAEQQDDDFRHVDPIHEPGELLRLVLDLLKTERDCDRVEVDLGSEVRGGDDVLDFDLRVRLDRDARGLDLLRDDLDRLLDVLEALRPGADDLAAAEEKGRGLRLLQAIDQAGELLRLVLGAAEDAGDSLKVECLPEGSRGDDVFDLEVRRSNTSEGRRRGSRRGRL